MLRAVQSGNSGEKKRGSNSISSNNDMIREEFEDKLSQKTSQIHNLQDKLKEAEFKFEGL